jgi:cytochrome b subunit of formate dehydrogenase
MDLHLRLQHGFLILLTLGALLTGKAVAGGLFPRSADFDLWYRVHQWTGMAAALLLAYHLTYLLVRGYVEGRNWPTFPLAWKKGDIGELRHQAAFVLGRKDARPAGDIFRASQKALYWGTGLLLATLAATGLIVGLWENLGSFGLPLLGFASRLHRGLSLVLVATFLWHLYGVLTWEGRFAPQWSWITGQLPEDLAAAIVPGHHRNALQQEEERLASVSRKSAEEEEEEARQLEKDEVEEDLQVGNRLAKEEKFVDALFHYRRALERYPGYSQARYNMAIVLGKMGERAMAAENFRQFLKDDPFHPLARKAHEIITDIEKEEEE